jgi:predicted transcriptional regulator of viral defense system
MAMYNSSISIKKIKKSPFTFQDALSWGVARHYLRSWLKNGQIFRISRGLYSRVNLDESESTHLMEAVKLVIGPSAVGLVSALSYYALTDIVPKQVWLIVPFTKRSSFKNIKTFRQRNPQWDIGIKKNKNFWITDLERTLVECLIYKKTIGVNEAISSIKKALSEKKTTLLKIRQMAKKMGMEHKIKFYLETLM